MSCCVKKHLDFLNLLSKIYPFQQRYLSETAEPDQVCAICECIYNIMHGNIPIPEGIKRSWHPENKCYMILQIQMYLKERNTLTKWRFNFRSSYSAFH